jgi:hypothetical protein
MTLPVSRRTPRKHNHTSNKVDSDWHGWYGILDFHEVRLLYLKFGFFGYIRPGGKRKK